eukprot:gene19510-biopygen42543
MYCDSVFLKGDAGADVAAATKEFVDGWLGDELRDVVSGWMTDNEASNDTAWAKIVSDGILPNASHLRCWAHIVSLAGHDFLNAPVFSSVALLGSHLSSCLKGK